jgi:glucosyl-3-phosphoglycerate phosphatase
VPEGKWMGQPSAGPPTGTTAGGRLLLVRHARTAGNAEGRPMGRRDLPLDAVGRVQAVGLTAALEGTIPVRTRVRIHSSPLVRAVDTIAGYTAARLLPVHRDPLLLEMDFGAAGQGPGRGRKLRVKEEHLYDPLPGGESLFDVWQRCMQFFARVEPEVLSGPTVVVVSHYRVSQLLAGLASGVDFETASRHSTFRPPNASLFEMPYQAWDRRATDPIAVWSPGTWAHNEVVADP